jgi:hypothetical protein
MMVDAAFSDTVIFAPPPADRRRLPTWVIALLGLFVLATLGVATLLIGNATDWFGSRSPAERTRQFAEADPEGALACDLLNAYITDGTGLAEAASQHARLASTESIRSTNGEIFLLYRACVDQGVAMTVL